MSTTCPEVVPALELVTISPEDYPVTVAQMKQHLNIEDDVTDWDELLLAYISAATTHVENTVSRALTPQVWILSLDSFPTTIDIPLRPLISVDSIDYLDADLVEQVVVYTDYTVNLFRRTVVAGSSGWPTGTSIQVTFTAGYADGYIPQSIRQAIKMIVADWFDQRENFTDGNSTKVPMCAPAEALLSPYRTVLVA